MSLENKAEILDVYTDQRQQLFGGGEDDPDNCSNWDEKTLKDVIEANMGKYKSYHLIHNLKDKSHLR